jgi:SAM-dependent methyltransferase
VRTAVHSEVGNAINGGHQVVAGCVAALKTRIPWWAKIGAKLALSRIPVSYKFWRRIGMFQLGPMEQPSYAYSVFRRHFDRAKFTRQKNGFAVLELGPGDCLSSAIIAHALGASACYLVDTGAYAEADLTPYRAMTAFLQEHGLNPLKMEGVRSLDELLRRCHALYGTLGLVSLRAIPDESLDLIWSQSVLEHIKEEEFQDVVREWRRLIRPDGVCSHHIDLKDHLGGALNNLRFSKDLWESEFMASSGFYTNRIRYTEMLTIFEQSGFDVEVVNADRWERLPTAREKFAEAFRDISTNELLVSGFDVILHPR